MKQSIFIIIALTFPIMGMAKTTSTEPSDLRIVVHSIEDRHAGSHGESCGFYGVWSTPGGAVREILMDELSKIEGTTLLEREHLSEIYESEFNHENLEESTKPERKKFIAANLAIAGVISEFEWCMSGGKQRIDIGGLLGVGELSLKHQSSSAHVAFDLRLIEVKTGKVLKTFKSEGKVEDEGFAFGADAFGLKLDKETFEKTPLGKANRIAVAEAMTQISVALKKYQAAEKKNL